MDQPIYFNRDISWLYFNERVLYEAASAVVPLVERIRFLSIYSSNLDEFYRVRMPVLLAMADASDAGNSQEILPDPSVSAYENARQIVNRQQQLFGDILANRLIPELFKANISLVYNSLMPASIQLRSRDYFFNTLAAYLEINTLNAGNNFFPANNSLYIAVELDRSSAGDTFAIVTIPSAAVSRFYSISENGHQYVIFIDDIIKQNLPFLFPGRKISGAYSIKITRDADLPLRDEFEGDIAEKIEYQLTQRDLGIATRLLYQPGIPNRLLQTIVSRFRLFNAARTQGGNYHNLKDLASFPVPDDKFMYPINAPAEFHFKYAHESLFNEIRQRDILINPPYSSYETVLRFFNEAAVSQDVEEIHTTMYRVASESRIVHALISAARNGKAVTVFVELKARFDEANNIKWAKRMKSAGVKIIYSIPNLKVHSKIALVKRSSNGRTEYTGLLATGNLNESTARFYTDHVLLTAHQNLTRELELVFMFLRKRRKPGENDRVEFDHLLVSQFNLQQKFISLVDNEIGNAKKGLPSGITIKLNNLEERVLINKLYEASCAGVRINLIVRSICCLVPGVKGLSENITIRRIVDRYLEHGRVFIFHNNGNELFFLGSSDWMNRNVYSRIEVCFPLYDRALQLQLKHMIALQLQDNQAAVTINEQLQNIPVEKKQSAVRSQMAIAEYVKNLEQDL
jgi:polyphosphate kinase